MCGITGLVAPADPDLGSRLRCMTDALAHRGPDGAGIEIAAGVGLGHRRLAVIDPTPRGRQPMPNEDGTVWITYNGEVYGTEPLRAWLLGKGHRFLSHTDTEILVHLYEEKGPDLVADLNGMFAFAIHDRARRRLTLARDRLGIKPLFWTHRNGEVLFASEIKALLATLPHRPSLDQEAIGQYLLQGYVSTPQTIFQGIRSLPPGHLLTIELGPSGEVGETVLRQYWDAPFTGDDNRSAVEIEAELEELLSEAVRSRMVADVPVGAFLSGGIDSSSVVGLMARSSAEPIRTFTIDLPGSDRGEGHKALAVARRYGTDHHQIDCTATNSAAYWDRLAHFDMPFNCPSILNAWLVSRAAREEVTVALSGDGGDELFGGYPRYWQLRGLRSRSRRNLPERLGARIPRGLRGRARFRRRGMDEGTWFITHDSPMEIEEAEELVGVSLDPWKERMDEIWNRSSGDAISRAMYLDLKTYLPDHILAKVDSASMAVSLEVRVPLLDHRVVELAGRIPSALQVDRTSGKLLMRRIARRLLPPELLDQEKLGFDPPVPTWEFASRARERLASLSSTDTRFREVLDGRLVDRWIRHTEQQLPWRVPRRAALWSIYQLERWLGSAGPSTPRTAASG
ncbi:MAG TPA: asparagine synthase (glutamine-hydrolyzing) [Thermoanaerobaculia bacterium]|nr:asparagine synthase (glutamine-hydrolyzing) [Thermoanaerobaculia bacterium]